MVDLIDRQAAIDAIVGITNCGSLRKLYEYVVEHDIKDRWSGGLVDAADAVIGLPSADIDLSGFSDKLWRAAYERGKAEAVRWIPCGEMPDTDRNVFIARGNSDMMTVCVGHYDNDLKQWYEDRNWFAKCLYDGLYWCEMPPLPEPYKDGEHDG